MSILNYLFVIALFVFSTARAEDENALDQFLAGLESYSAEFEQSLVDASGDILESSSGTVYLNYPGKFHWRYIQPYAQRLITDGETLWVYDEDLAQVTIKSIENELDNTPAAILSGTDDLYQHFTLTDIGIEAGIQLLELAPRDEDNQFHSIRLGFEQNKLVLMVMFDKLGQVTKVRFEQPERNSSQDDGLFSFTPPDGVDVIDGRTAGVE